MIPGDLLSAFPHRQFHTLPGLLDSWAALPNSNPNACVPMQGGSLYHFYDGLWYDPAERRTHDLPSERRTCYRQVVLIVDDVILSSRIQDTLHNKLNICKIADLSELTDPSALLLAEAVLVAGSSKVTGSSSQPPPATPFT